MNKQSSSLICKLFGLKSLAWLIFAWTCFLLTLVGFFYVWIIWAIFFLSIVLLAKNEVKKLSQFRFSRELLFISIGILLVTSLLSLFTTPTLFSGRDQGSISEAAIRLAENHRLTFSTPASDVFFEIRGTGKALNFPGFFYTRKGNLTTQFPLVYIAWLATFYATFGIIGFTIANTILSILFLATFYLLARSFMSGWVLIASLFFLITSLSVFWFPKYTLSENMALYLLWLSLFSLLAFLKQQNKLNFVLLIASSFLLVFTRIEGVAFLATSVAVLFFHKKAWNYFKKKPKSKLFVIFFLMGLIFLANFFWNINFYKELFKAILPTIGTASKNLNTPAEQPHIFQIFRLYGMLGFFITSLIACSIYAIRKNLKKLIPFLLISPTLIYFFDSHISPDHPWMLRRFAFSLLPIAIFYSALFIYDLEKFIASHKKPPVFGLIPKILATALLVGNIPAFFYFSTFSENKNLLEQINKLSQRFSVDDLILFDKKTTGDGWAMAAGPMNFLYKKNAAYFYNIEDVTRLDLKSFKNVYLIIPDSRIPDYTESSFGHLLTPIDQYTLSAPQLKLDSTASQLIVSFPEKKMTTTHGIIFKVSK